MNLNYQNLKVKKIFRIIPSIFTCLLFWLCFQNTLGSEYENPVVKNFSKFDYNADNQNWSVAEDSEGNVFFANNKGLLEFNGISWKLYPSPKGNIIRSVAVDHTNRIYSSGYRELGYWKRNKSGTLVYISLKGLAEKNFIPNVEFWRIIPLGKKVYFHSFRQMMIWDGDQISTVNLPTFSNSMYQVGEKIVIDQADGLYTVEDNQLKPLLQDPFFNQKQIKFVFQDETKRLIIGTFSDGIYTYNGQRFNVLNPEWNDFFIKNKVTQASKSSNGNIIIGTHLEGIIAIDKTGEVLFRLNTQNGLQNNTVLGMTIDKNGNIWQALDKGIDFITFREKESFTLHPVKDIGAVYSAAIHNEKIYLATNQGLYYKKLKEPDSNFRLIPQSEGQVWICTIFGGKLFAGLSNGTFVVTDQGLQKISNINGVFAITPDLRKPGFLLQSTYSEIVSLDFTGKEPRWNKNLKWIYMEMSGLDICIAEFTG